MLTAVIPGRSGRVAWSWFAQGSPVGRTRASHRRDTGHCPLWANGRNPRSGRINRLHPHDTPVDLPRVCLSSPFSLSVSLLVRVSHCALARAWAVTGAENALTARLPPPSRTRNHTEKRTTREATTEGDGDRIGKSTRIAFCLSRVLPASLGSPWCDCAVVDVHRLQRFERRVRSTPPPPADCLIAMSQQIWGTCALLGRHRRRGMTREAARVDCGSVCGASAGCHARLSGRTRTSDSERRDRAENGTSQRDREGHRKHATLRLEPRPWTAAGSFLLR